MSDKELSDSNTPDDNQLETPLISPEEEKPKKPGFFTRLFGWWFNKDSRFGKFNRSVVRVLAFLVILFSLGFVATYFALFLPAKKALEQRTNEYIALETQYTEAQNELTTLANELALARSELILATDQLAKSENHMELLRLLNDLMEANYNIAGNKFDLARTNLENAQARLLSLEKAIAAADPELFTSISGRLTQAISDLRIKSSNTAIDVTLMVNQLREFETKSFGSEK